MENYIIYYKLAQKNYDKTETDRQTEGQWVKAIRPDSKETKDTTGSWILKKENNMWNFKSKYIQSFLEKRLELRLNKVRGHVGKDWRRKQKKKYEGKIHSTQFITRVLWSVMIKKLKISAIMSVLTVVYGIMSKSV